MEFTCCNCKKVFLQGRNDAIAHFEKDVLFPNDPEENLLMACEPCFIKIMDFNEPGMKRYAEFINKNNMDA